jgi:hypothetical protein
MAQEVTPDAIMRLGSGYWGAKTLLSGVELGLFTELARRPLALEDVRARLNLHERSVRDFLDALVPWGCPSASRAPTPTRRRPTFTWTGPSRPTWAACWR